MEPVGKKGVVGFATELRRGEGKLIPHAENLGIQEDSFIDFRWSQIASNRFLWRRT